MGMILTDYRAAHQYSIWSLDLIRKITPGNSVITETSGRADSASAPGYGFVDGIPTFRSRLVLY